MSSTTAVNDEGNIVEITFEDEMQELAYGKIIALIKKRNDLVAQSNAAQGNREDLASTLTETSDDPEIVAAREARDEAIMRLHALVTPKVADLMENAEANATGTADALKELEGKLRPSLTFYKSLYGDDAAKLLPKRIAQKGGASAGGSGRRIRGYSVEIVIDDEGTVYDNFASASKYLGKETAELQDKFFEAAGNPKALKDAPDEVKFSVQFTDVDEDGNEEENTAEVIATREAKPTAVEAEVAQADEQE